MFIYLLVILMLTCNANFTSMDRPGSPQTERPTVEQCEKCRRRTDFKCDPTRNATGHVNCKCINIGRKNDGVLHCKDRLDEPKCKVFCETERICFRDPNERCDENEDNSTDRTDGKTRSDRPGSPQTERPTVEQCEKCRRRTDLKCDPTRNATGHVNCKCISIGKKNDGYLHCKDRLDEPKCKVFCEAEGICFRDPNKHCDKNKGDGTDGTDGKTRSESSGQTSAISTPSTEKDLTGNTATESEDVTTTSADDKNVRNPTSAAIETTTEKTKRKCTSTTRTTVGTTTEELRSTATQRPKTRTLATTTSKPLDSTAHPSFETTPPQNETISPKESSGQTSAISAPSTETYLTGNTATESEDVTTTSADDKNVRNPTSAAIETTTEKTKRKRRSTTRTTVGTTTEKSRRTATSKSPSQRPKTSRTLATPSPKGLTIGNTLVVMSNSDSSGGNRLTLDVNLIQMLILIIQIYALA